MSEHCDQRTIEAMVHIARTIMCSDDIGSSEPSREDWQRVNDAEMLAQRVLRVFAGEGYAEEEPRTALEQRLAKLEAFAVRLVEKLEAADGVAADLYDLIDEGRIKALRGRP